MLYFYIFNYWLLDVRYFRSAHREIKKLLFACKTAKTNMFWCLISQLLAGGNCVVFVDATVRLRFSKNID